MTINLGALIEDMEHQIDRALLMEAPKDTVLQVLSGACVWRTGDNSSGNFSISIPQDSDFYATHVDVFVGARLIDQSSLETNASELTFRPSQGASVCNLLAVAGTITVQDFDFVAGFEDSFNGTYQGDSGLVAGQFYSHRYGQNSVNYEAPSSAYPGGRKFRVPHRVKRGSSITVHVQPTFSRVVNATIKTQFQARAVFTGFKLVRRNG